MDYFQVVTGDDIGQRCSMMGYLGKGFIIHVQDGLGLRQGLDGNVGSFTQEEVEQEKALMKCSQKTKLASSPVCADESFGRIGHPVMKWPGCPQYK